MQQNEKSNATLPYKALSYEKRSFRPVRCDWSKRRGMEYPLFVVLATLLILPILQKMRNDQTRNMIKNQIRNIENFDQLSPGAMVSELFEVLLRHDIEYSTGLTQFSRGYLLLEQTYQEIKKLKMRILDTFREMDVEAFGEEYYELQDHLYHNFRRPFIQSSQLWKNVIGEHLSEFGEVSIEGLVTRTFQKQLTTIRIKNKKNNNVVNQWYLKEIEKRVQ